MKNYFIGAGITSIGIILGVFFKEAHFYTFFSIGLFMIFLEIYKHIVHKKLFTRWTIWEHVAFWGMLLVASVIIDILGIRLNYWYYPDYVTTFDTLLKFTFEWCIALMYITLAFLIGVAILKKHKVQPVLAYAGSLVMFVIPMGFITEFFNHIAPSWIVIGTPFSQYSINGYFIVFQTLGYWVMALIPWIIYKTVITLRSMIFR